MAGTTQNTDETLVSTDDQTTTKQKATRSKTNKSTETQNTQAGDEKASDQGDLLNSQGPDNGDSHTENLSPDDVKNSEVVNDETKSKDIGNSTESVKPKEDELTSKAIVVSATGNETSKLKEVDTSETNYSIKGALTEAKGNNIDPLVINVTNNGFKTVLEPLSRAALEVGKTTSITCHNQTFKHQVLENLRQLKGLGKNLRVEE